MSTASNRSLDWNKVRLGEIAREVRDLYEPTQEEVIPYIGLGNIEAETLRLNSVGESSETKSTKKKFRAGDILFGSLRPYFRKVYRPDFSGVCSTDITVIRARKKVHQGFLFYLIASPQFINYATNVSTGTRMPRANWGVLKDSLWRIPDLDKQAYIERTLSSFDRLIENNLRRIEILEEMARLIYREWFVHFRFPGHEEVEMVDSELGPIPERWDICSLSDLVDPQYGYTESADEEPVGPKFLRGTDINKQSYINWSTVPYCEIDDNDLEKYRLSVGDVVVIRMADPGKPGIVEEEVNAVFASYLVRFNLASDSIDPYYLFYFLLSDAYQGYISGASTGTTRKSASAGVLTGIDILLPPQKVLVDFRSAVGPIRSLISILLRQNSSLASARDLLLPRLISGQLSLSSSIS